MEDTALRRVRHLALNMASFAAPLLGALVAIPVLLRHLEPSAFSLLGMYWVIIGYASIFEMGMGRSVTRHLAMISRDDADAAREVVGAAFLTALMIGAAAGVILFFVLPLVFGRFISIPANLAAENQAAIRWIALAVPPLVCASVLIGVLEARMRFGWIATIRVPTGLAMFLVPAVLAAMGYRLGGLLLGIVVVRWVLVVILAFPVERECPGALLRPRIIAQRVRELLSFGGWLTVSAIIGPMLVYLDRFILSSEHGLVASAAYTTPFEAVVRFLIVPSAVVSVMFPRMVAVAGNRASERRLFWEANGYVAAAILPVTLIFVFLGRPVFEAWLGRSGLIGYDMALTVSLAAMLAVGLLINACAHIPQALVQARGFARWTALLHVTELGLYLLYAPRIIGAYGVYGAAYTWLIRSTISAVALYLLSARLMRAGHNEVQV